MKMESLSFTADDYDEIVGGYFERERRHLITRLWLVVDETEALIPHLQDECRSAERPIGRLTRANKWNAIETLAHMAIAAQFFGSLIHMIAENEEVGDPIQVMNLRDQAMADALELPEEVLVKQLRENIERTIDFLEKVPYDDLRQGIRFASRALTAEDFCRISLCHHLEDHLEQMREALGAAQRAD
jgi:hypothetical protein